MALEVMSLGSAIEELERRYAPLGQDEQPWPTSPGHSEHEVRLVEHALGRTLPHSFRTSILGHRFLRVVVGNVGLAARAATLTQWLVEPNAEDVPYELRWWGAGPRPETLLMIGVSDAHTLVLDCTDGCVRAISADEPSRSPLRVASCFQSLFCGLVTLFCVGLGSEAAERQSSAIALASGADPAATFWWRYAVRAA